ncbi:MAG: TfoX/Sxy family protein [Marinosulfonomonas sp.]|nr:TfoX/Sxy family protein [Marinosulfonomonas sp.]
MSITSDDIAFIEDLFAPLGTITHRKMMGGLTIYCDGQVFSILDSANTLYLKAKGDFANQIADAGAVQFGADTGKTMGYWTMPEAALDDEYLARDWATRALSEL